MAHTPLFRALLRALQRARRANFVSTGKPEPTNAAGTRLTRRQLLQGALAAGAAAAAAPLTGPLQIAHGKGTQPRIAIVGGGLAGLNAAYQLRRQGLIATVYEARGRLGGRVHSVTGPVGEGLTVELGGELINSNHEDMLGLAADFGLELFNRAEDAARFPFPAEAFLFAGRSLTEQEVAEELRPLAAQIAADAQLLDEDFEAHAPAFDRQTVAGYLDQHADKLGVPFVRTLIENAIRSELGCEADETSVIHLLFLLPTVEGEAVEVLGSSDELYTVVGGTSRLIDALGAFLSDQIQLRHVLTRVEQRGQSYSLSFQGLPRIEADHVILAMPFAVLRDVELDVRLPGRLRRMIRELDSGRNEKLIVGVSSRAWRQEDGFTQEAWADSGLAVAWDATQRQAERSDGALTLFVGGAQVAATAVGNARVQAERLLQGLESSVPGLSAAATGAVLRTRWNQERFSKGAYVTFRPGQYTRFGEFLYIESDDPEECQEVAVGRLVFAGEHLSDEFYGFMNGAAQTGRLAASIVARNLAGHDHSAARRSADVM